MDSKHNSKDLSELNVGIIIETNLIFIYEHLRSLSVMNLECFLSKISPTRPKM